MANEQTSTAPSTSSPERESKKQKTEDATRNPLRADVTSDASREALAAAYRAGKPYPHCVIPDLCDPALLTAVREELIENVEATYKETDLFNMFQTGDLANLDGLDAAASSRLVRLRALRDALYSPAFRAFVSDITGCGELSDRTDCACNVHARGCHLLCHDDVIGTRAVSFIIYLTDPAQPWTAVDGGALELYPEHPELKLQPDVFPTATVLPTWNSLAMFAVQPGVSFHSIQEVFAEDRPRMSIQGWYHRAAPPSNSERATLRQLQLQGGAMQGPFSKYPDNTPAEADMEGQPIPEADLVTLRRFMNPAYLDPATWPKVFARFREEGSVQLQSFLRRDVAARLAELAAAADARDGLDACRAPGAYDVGQRDGWRAFGPAFKQRYLRYMPGSAATSDEAGEALADVCHNLLATPAFRRFIYKLTTLELIGERGEVRRFRPGLDYTVAHHGVLAAKPCLDAVLCVLGADTPESHELWEAGEVGGYEAYLLADDDEEAPTKAEVYRANADGTGPEETGVINISPAHNCLSLVLRDEETDLLKFVKYVSAAAPGSRWDVSMEYELEKDEDETPAAEEEFERLTAAEAEQA
ncbi:hypothetical protein QBZ16_000803 [Prototheca wickerhamii]|uniref:Fe2OG dioxygenase domain-containing protein n=1 Tax=Prototheca wickerhamii TaxID=3111 RepID=A0AAD9INV8_PROWI|nr:hypothetical protein QBZ16_000803 [Prototheca wickerhamii]